MITKNLRLRGKYQYPGAKHDRLYKSGYTYYKGDQSCEIGYASISP